MRSIPAHICLVLCASLLADAPPASARTSDAPYVLLLPAKPNIALPSWESFRANLVIQLRPYGLDCRVALERPKKPREVKAAEALAVVWYSVNEGRLAIHVVDFGDPRRVVQTMALGEPREGVEREMAVSVRTLLRSRLEEIQRRRQAGQKKEPRPPRRSPPAIHTPAPEAPGPAARLVLGLGYGVAAFPQESDLRHGPTLTLRLRLPGPARIELGFQPGFHGAEDGRGVSWNRQAFSFWLDALARIELATQLETAVGVRVRGAMVSAEAERGDERQSEMLGEIGLGGVGSLVWWFRGAWGLKLDVVVAWLPLTHQVNAEGIERASPQRLELAASLGLQLAL